MDRALERRVGVEGGKLGIDGDVGEDAGEDVLDVGTEDALRVGRAGGA